MNDHGAKVAAAQEVPLCPGGSIEVFCEAILARPKAIAYVPRVQVNTFINYRCNQLQTLSNSRVSGIVDDFLKRPFLVLSVKKKGVSCSSIIIDRISVTINYTEHHERVELLDRLKQISSSEYFARYAAKFRYQQSLQLHPGQVKDRTMLVQAHPYQPSTPFFRMEYNPATADPVTFRMIVYALLPGGWSDFVLRSVCTRIDLAVDITGIRVDELIAHWPGMRRSRQFFASGKTVKHSHETAPLETYEIGAYDGVRHVTIYDRVEQIGKQNLKLIIKDVVPMQAVTRIEFRLRPKVPWPGVAAMPNPFAELKVQEFALLPPLEDEEKYKMFVRLCQTDGPQNALLMLSESTRKVYKKRLEQGASPWWKPCKIWGGLDSALAAVAEP